MSWKFETYLGSNIPTTDLKRKCPVCKKIRKFLRIDVTCSTETVFCEGEYIPLYMCSSCQIIKSFAKRDK